MDKEMLLSVVEEYMHARNDWWESNHPEDKIHKDRTFQYIVDFLESEKQESWNEGYAYAEKHQDF